MLLVVLEWVDKPKVNYIRESKGLPVVRLWPYSKGDKITTILLTKPHSVKKLALLPQNYVLIKAQVLNTLFCWNNLRIFVLLSSVSSVFQNLQVWNYRLSVFQRISPNLNSVELCSILSCDTTLLLLRSKDSNKCRRKFCVFFDKVTSASTPLKLR